jgi:hypothetical protein
MKIKRAELVWEMKKPEYWYVQVDEPTQVIHVIGGEVAGLDIWAKNAELIKAARADLESVGYELASSFALDILPCCTT